jgi:hypothetical protein
MGRFAARVIAVIAILCSNVGYSQTSVAQPSDAATPVAKFRDLAGKWTGQANNHSVTLEIDPSGKFRATSAVGVEEGEARIEGAILIVPLEEHKGTLVLLHHGDTLKGSGVLDGKTWTVSLRRGPHRR